MIWGFDTAARCTGWCAGVGDSRPVVGAWKYDKVGDDIGKLLGEFDEDLDRLADRFPPTGIMFEAPILGPFPSLLKLRKLYSTAGYLELWAIRHQVPIEEEDLRNLKRVLTGTSKAEKPQMVAMARKLGISLPTGPAAEDGADAFAAWLVGIQKFAREHQPRWDRALYSERGRLDL